MKNYTLQAVNGKNLRATIPTSTGWKEGDIVNMHIVNKDEVLIKRIHSNSG